MCLFISSLAALLGLRCYTAFLWQQRAGLHFPAVHGLRPWCSPLQRSRGSRAPERRFGTRGAWAQLLRGTQGFPGSGRSARLQHWRVGSSPRSHPRSPRRLSQSTVQWFALVITNVNAPNNIDSKYIRKNYTELRKKKALKPVMMLGSSQIPLSVPDRRSNLKIIEYSLIN